MIIDSHNHPDWHGHDLKKTVQNMDEHGIDRTWILSWEAPIDEWDPQYNRVFVATADGPIPFSHCLRYKEREPERFVLGYAPDPRRPGAIDRLRAAVDLYGVEVCGELKLRMMYDNPDALRMFRVCGDLGLPVVVHIDYELSQVPAYPRPNWWYGGGIEPFVRAVACCPETVFVGHGPGFWAHISDDGQYGTVAYPAGPVIGTGRLSEAMRRHTNLWADLSAGSGRNALARDPGHARRFVEEFQDRLLFARDTFDWMLMETLEALDLPQSAMAKLTSRNSLRLAGDG